MDFFGLFLMSIASLAVSLTVTYYIIKGAVKNAIIETRNFPQVTVVAAAEIDDTAVN